MRHLEEIYLADYGNITVDKKEFQQLEQLYNAAVKGEMEAFVWREYRLLVSYAKYLIEYLKPKFK